MNPDNATFDDAYTQIASRARNIDDLLTSFFGFLHRKTDFFVEIPDEYNAKMGFRKGAAEDMLLKTFNKFSMKTPDPKDISKIETKSSIKTTKIDANKQKQSMQQATTTTMQHTEKHEQHDRKRIHCHHHSN